MIVTLIRTAILYLFVIVGMRIMGKRQIGDMQPNELVTTILISEIATVPIQDMDQPVLNGVMAIALLVALEVIMSIVSMKSGLLRCAINGRPIIVIRTGEIDQKALKQLRMTISELMENLRSQQVFSVDDVELALVETNGSISLMLTPDKQPLTVGQSEAPLDTSGVPVPVICDGKLQPHFMTSMQVSEHQVRQALTSRKLSIDEVFLMTLDANGKASVIKKEQNK